VSSRRDLGIRLASLLATEPNEGEQRSNENSQYDLVDTLQQVVVTLELKPVEVTATWCCRCAYISRPSQDYSVVFLEGIVRVKAVMSTTQNFLPFLVICTTRERWRTLYFVYPCKIQQLPRALSREHFTSPSDCSRR
jgi:hypothetical protein